MPRIPLIRPVRQARIVTQPGRNPKAQELLEEARQAYERGDLEAANASISRAMRLDPDDVHLYEIRASLWNDSGSPQYAVADASRALRLDPASVPALMERGTALLVSGRPGDAVEDFNRALELVEGEDRADVLFARGKALAQSRHWDDAIHDFTEVIKASGDVAVAYNERGHAYAQAGRQAKALKDLTHAIEMEPDNPAFRLNRGSTLFNMNRKDEAEADWNEAYRLGRKDKELVAVLKQRFGLLDKPLPGARAKRPAAASPSDTTGASAPKTRATGAKRPPAPVDEAATPTVKRTRRARREG
jgi:tetratricopeptide (TPR) repeat protein